MIPTKRADEIYEKIKPFIQQHKGKIIAIELETGDYFMGETMEEAYESAHKKYPDKKFFFKRVGFKAVYFVGALSG